MLAARREEFIAKLPPSLRNLLDAEVTAGNELLDVELGRVDREGQVGVIIRHPFRSDRAAIPAELSYRETLDHDPQLFEYFTSDEKFSLIAVKFKPMKLVKLVGPENPTEKHIARMKKNAEDEEAKAKQRAAEAHAPPLASSQTSDPDPDPFKRFLASMTITFDMWHDGLGYDLDALKQVSPAELKSIEQTLINHHPRDWRDIEALAHIDSPKAREAVESALKSRDPQIRQTAMTYAAEKADPADRERLLIKSLENDVIFGGLTQAIDEVPDFHPPAVIEALFRGALNRDGDVAVHFAALLMFLHGKSNEPFDWSQRPFFLRFNTSDRAERKAVFRELCEKIGADPTKYLR